MSHRQHYKAPGWSFVACGRLARQVITTIYASETDCRQCRDAIALRSPLSKPLDLPEPQPTRKTA